MRLSLRATLYETGMMREVSEKKFYDFCRLLKWEIWCTGSIYVLARLYTILSTLEGVNQK